MVVSPGGASAQQFLGAGHGNQEAIDAFVSVTRTLASPITFLGPGFNEKRTTCRYDPHPSGLVTWACVRQAEAGAGSSAYLRVSAEDRLAEAHTSRSLEQALSW